MHIVLPMMVLLFTYLALSANLQFSNLLLGLFISIGILSLLRLPRRPVAWVRLPSAFLALVTFIARLILNTLKSGIQVVQLILRPKMPIKPGIIAIPAGCKSKVGQAISAHTISLPPGELFVEMGDDGIMYIHSLDVTLTDKQAGSAQKVQGNLLRRILD